MRRTEVAYGRMQRTPRSFSSAFNSSVPQRPGDKNANRTYGGRPLGPSTYYVPMPKWKTDPDRQ